MAVKDSNKQESDLINDYLTERFEEAWYALDEYCLLYTSQGQRLQFNDVLFSGRKGYRENLPLGPASMAPYRAK